MYRVRVGRNGLNGAASCLKRGVPCSRASHRAEREETFGLEGGYAATVRTSLEAERCWTGRRAERMDPITLIVAALAAGASAGTIDALKDNAKEAAKAAYGKLHDRVKRRFQGNASAEVILAEHQADPETYAGPLAKKLTEAGAGEDGDLVAAAQALMDLVDAAGAKSGKYTVTINNSEGVYVGDHGIQVNRFDA
jgi:hypothetical protein